MKIFPPSCLASVVYACMSVNICNHMYWTKPKPQTNINATFFLRLSCSAGKVHFVSVYMDEACVYMDFSPTKQVGVDENVVSANRI